MTTDDERMRMAELSARILVRRWTCEMDASELPGAKRLDELHKLVADAFAALMADRESNEMADKLEAAMDRIAKP